MPDVLSPADRSYCMSRVGGKDTKPEKIVRSLVHSLGFRFRLHNRSLPGTPDLVLARHRKVIFVHGCFWHGHPGCRRARRPATNVDFWNTKLDRNVARDRKVQRQLRKEGWGVMVIWECQTRDAERLLNRIHRFLPP